jgi:hypothetical protein
MNEHYLCSYKPLRYTSAGRNAIAKSDLPPFIDGSCRREPDFQAQAPSISAICRKGKFAPRLFPGDHIIYITVQMRFGRVDGWALVASLNVVERFNSHQEAAGWYQTQGYALPSNCLVPGNSPQPFHLTTKRLPKEVKARLDKTPDPIVAVRLWDATYALRARDCGVFLACKADYLELNHPPILGYAEWLKIFGYKRCTQNPPKITRKQYQSLMEFAAEVV